MSAKITRSKCRYESSDKAEADAPEDSIRAQETGKRKRLTNRQVIHSKTPLPPMDNESSSQNMTISESNSRSKEKAADISSLDVGDIAKPSKPLPINLKIDASTSGRWLMKSEPGAFSLDDLYAQSGPAEWDGVRNHAAKVSTVQTPA